MEGVWGKVAGVSASHVNAERLGLQNVLFGSSMAGAPPVPLCKALSTCIIRPFISWQTKHVILGPHQLDTAHTSIHGRKGFADKVKLAKGCERGKGRVGRIR